MIAPWLAFLSSWKRCWPSRICSTNWSSEKPTAALGSSRMHGPSPWSSNTRLFARLRWKARLERLAVADPVLLGLNLSLLDRRLDGAPGQPYVFAGQSCLLQRLVGDLLAEMLGHGPLEVFQRLRLAFERRWIGQHEPERLADVLEEGRDPVAEGALVDRPLATSAPGHRRCRASAPDDGSSAKTAPPAPSQPKLARIARSRPRDESSMASRQIIRSSDPVRSLWPKVTISAPSSMTRLHVPRSSSLSDGMPSVLPSSASSKSA